MPCDTHAHTPQYLHRYHYMQRQHSVDRTFRERPRIIALSPCTSHASSTKSTATMSHPKQRSTSMSISLHSSRSVSHSKSFSHCLAQCELQHPLQTHFSVPTPSFKSSSSSSDIERKISSSLGILKAFGLSNDLKSDLRQPHRQSSCHQLPTFPRFPRTSSQCSAQGVTRSGLQQRLEESSWSDSSISDISSSDGYPSKRPTRDTNDFMEELTTPLQDKQAAKQQSQWHEPPVSELTETGGNRHGDRDLTESTPWGLNDNRRTSQLTQIHRPFLFNALRNSLKRFANRCKSKSSFFNFHPYRHHCEPPSTSPPFTSSRTPPFRRRHSIVIPSPMHMHRRRQYAARQSNRHSINWPIHLTLLPIMLLVSLNGMELCFSSIMSELQKKYVHSPAHENQFR